MIESLAPSWTDPENRDRIKEIQMQLPLLRAVQEAAITRAASREHNALAKAGNDSADRATPINIATKKSLGSLADSFDKQVADTKNELSADNRSLNLTVALTTFAALVIGISVAVLLERIISGATRSVLVRAEAIAAGDLAFDDLEVRSQDELGDLTRAINTMSGNLKRMILAISQNSLQVASASEDFPLRPRCRHREPTTRRTKRHRLQRPCRKCHARFSRFQKIALALRKRRARLPKQLAKAVRSWNKPWPK